MLTLPLEVQDLSGAETLSAPDWLQRHCLPGRITPAFYFEV